MKSGKEPVEAETKSPWAFYEVLCRDNGCLYYHIPVTDFRYSLFALSSFCLHAFSHHCKKISRSIPPSVHPSVVRLSVCSEDFFIYQKTIDPGTCFLVYWSTRGRIDANQLFLFFYPHFSGSFSSLKFSLVLSFIHEFQSVLVVFMNSSRFLHVNV